MIFKSKFPNVVIPNKSISEIMFEDWDDRDDHKVAFIDAFDENLKQSFVEFKQLSFKIGKGLQEKGFRKGDVAAIISPNCIFYPSIFHGIILSGGVVTTSNPQATEEEIAKQIKDAKSSFIFTIADLSEKINEAIKLAKISATVIVIGSEDYYSLLENDGKVNIVKSSPDDLAVLPYSSGTTGLPKGVMLSHKSIVSYIFQIQVLDAASYTISSVIGAILPMYHIYGMISFIICSVYSRHTTLVFSKFDLIRLLECIQSYRVTHLNIVPPIALAFAKHPAVLKYDLSSLLLVNSGAAPLSSEIQNEILARTKIAVRQGYGMSETPTGTIVCPYTPGVIRKPGSSGILLANVEAKVISVSDGRELGENEHGEVCLRCPNLMSGYLNRPEENIIDKDGFLHTGDIGYVDFDGDWFIVDRLKELIKYKGFQVPPAELEALLLTHPKVLDAAVIGKPDLEAGELPTAFVVLKPDQKIKEKEISEWINSKVSHYKHLRGGVIFVDQIPKSPSGKILRRLLKGQLDLKAKL